MEVKYRCIDSRYGNDSTAIRLSSYTGACTLWEYDDLNSFVAEFNLGGQEWKRTLLGTVHSFGYMVGLIIIGPITDRIGRKQVGIITGLLEATFGVSKSFCTDYWFYVALEFLDAACGSHGSPIFTLSIEIVSYEKRILFVIMSYVGYAMGFSVLPLTAWTVSYWRYTLRIIYGSAFIYFALFFALDESPRWLLSKGRKDEAVVIIKKMAKISKVEIEERDLNDLAHEDIKSVKLIQLLRDTFASKALLKRFLICVTWWTSVTFVSYGLQINSVSLPGNKYVNFSYFTLTEIVGVLLTAYLLMSYKRKMPLSASFMLAALMCVAQAFTPADISWLKVLLFMIGKVMAVVCFTIIYIYTSELFPTYTRSSMHALCSALGRCGSMIAPQTPLLIPYWHGLPSLVCGIVAAVAGLVTLLAPNTSDDALPDNIQQAEAIGHKDTFEKDLKKDVFWLRRRDVDEKCNGENRF
ncbi:major facilitator superfamily domain-containing protein [Phthorimaea operculella]|nr:major facilitator superfamily domain-containing protein [Phthorimaea operculella]